MHRIEREDDLRRALPQLSRACPHMSRVIDAVGVPPLRRERGGFPGLARIVVGQQLSIASAGAIWGRLEATVTPFTPLALQSQADGDLRAVGLSRPKIVTLREVARAFLAGDLHDSDDLGCPDDELDARLLRLKGIGPWTRDIYRLFCLGDGDAFAPGDLALQVAAAHAMGTDDRLTAQELTEAAEQWRPHRGVAARLLWAYYRHIGKAATGVPV